jgi:hypothetical protein
MTEVRKPSEILIAKIKACIPYLDEIADISLDALEQRREKYLRDGFKVRDAIFQGIEEGFTTEEILRMIIGTGGEVSPETK